MDTDIDSPVSSTKSESETNSNLIHIETRKKSTHDQTFDDRRKSVMEISQTSNSGDDSPTEGTSVVHTKLPPGKVSILYFVLHNINDFKRGRECVRAQMCHSNN